LSSGPSKRERLEAGLTEHLGRRLSARTLLFHQAVAGNLGLNPTDLKCLDLARSESEMTAGRLAKLTGLSTAAMTSVIDRLEKSGLVRRERAASDRRKVFVRPLPERAAEVSRLFEPLDQAMHRLFNEYSVDDLELIRKFAIKLADVLEAETMKLGKKRSSQQGHR